MPRTASPTRSRVAFSVTAIGAIAIVTGLSARSASSGTADESPSPAPSVAVTESEPPVELIDLSRPKGVQVLTGIAGQRLSTPLTVQVVRAGVSLVGRPVSFRLLAAPAKGMDDTRLETAEAVSDGDGIVRTEMTLGATPGDYVIGAFYAGALTVEPVRIKVIANRPSWVFFLVFGLLGGLGIFILGMDIAGTGLKNAAGEKMRGFLTALTSNRLIGLVVGIVATAVLQSSSATTVMLVGFVSATMMTFAQAIGVMMGAKIGTTITTQLIAFNLSEYSLLLVAIGFIMRVMARRKGFKHLGDILLGFGFIFFGLGIMSDAMRPLRTVPAFTELLVSFGERPALGILVAVGFTAIVQSSAATIGLAIALCSGGLLSLEGALPLAWGAHIGTCATALLSSLGANRAGKQVAVSHLVFSVLGVAAAFPFLSIMIDISRWMTTAMGSSSAARELANGHMLFTVLSGLLFLPFTKQIAWLTEKLVPSEKTEPPFGPIFLNEAAMSMPVLALEQAHREIVRAGQIVLGMLVATRDLLAKPSEEHAATIAHEDDKVDALERAIRPFLAKIDVQGADEEFVARQRAYFYIVQDLETIGDIITKEVAAAGRKLAELGVVFSVDGLAELQHFHGKIVEKAERVFRATETSDHSLAEESLQLRFKEHALERKLRESHLRRLQAEQPETIETSALHLSVLGNLGSVGRQLDDIAGTILREL